MTTYRDEALTNGDTTRWLYDEPSGCMTNKVYADGKGPSYSYTPDGKLSRRVWARGIATDYTYDNAGNLTRTEYSDTTPTITMAYDRVGNLTEATTAGVVTNLYAYDIVGNCTNEWQNDFNLTRYYDTLGRSTGYAINGTRQTAIAYDTYGRISTMTTPTGGVLCTGAAAAKRSLECCVPPAQGGSGLPTASNGGEFTWTYLPGSDLKASLQYPNGLTASWTYDANNQLIQVCNATPTNVISQFDYTYDAAGRRVSIAKTGSAFGDLSGSVDSYTYNARSELISARRTKNGQPIPGFSEDFDYDPIGNRRSSATYNEKGEAQASTYQANNLNQYTQRTTPGYAAVRGEADPNATVTVNENPTFRLGSYYFGSDNFDNSSSGGLANLETYAVLREEKVGGGGEEENDLVSATTNQVYLAHSHETFAYDDDGNQTLISTKTGLWRVTFNGENWPVLWVRDSDNATLVMSYDHMGRRRAKNAQRFFYDGYLQIADNSGNAYTWDCTEPVATRPLAWYRADSAAFYAHDGNKNVSEVFSSDGEIVAHYDYASFGGFTTQHGESAAINPWRFSAEYAEEDTATVYYNYRHSLQREGRWLSRDLIGEKDGGNEYAYNKNSLGGYDRLGLSCCGGNLGDFGSLITSHFLGESAGCIPPPGLVPNQSTANEPCSGSAGVSLAAYCVWGGSVSFESGICCQGGSRYRWVTMTTCVGLGVGAKLPTPDIPSVSKSGKGECPSEGTVYTIGTGFDLPFGTLGARAETFGISPVDGGYCSRKGCDVKDVCDFYQPSVGLSLAWRFFDICSTSRIKFERID